MCECDRDRAEKRVEMKRIACESLSRDYFEENFRRYDIDIGNFDESKRFLHTPIMITTTILNMSYWFKLRKLIMLINTN